MRDLQYIKQVIGPRAVSVTVGEFIRVLNGYAGGDWRRVRQVHAGPRLVELIDDLNTLDCDRKCVYLRSSCENEEGERVDEVAVLSMVGVNPDGVTAIGTELFFVYIN